MEDRGCPGVHGWRIRTIFSQFPRNTGRRMGHGGGIEHERRISLCKARYPLHVEQRGGRIINFASNAGRSSSPVLGCSYTAAKTGVIGITRHLAKEYAGRGIVVNTVAPGPLDGDRVADQLRNPQDRQALVASIPIGRLGREAEIAAVVMFLANDAPTYMTGAILDVNGGLVLAA